MEINFDLKIFMWMYRAFCSIKAAHLDYQCLWLSPLCLQAIKQKLHMKPWTGEERPLTDVQQEEDKAKMLLGAKLLVSITIEPLTAEYVPPVLLHHQITGVRAKVRNPPLTPIPLASL